MEREPSVDEIELRDLVVPVMRRWRAVVAIVMTAICLVVMRLIVATPQYEARARLIVLAPNQAVTDLQTLQLYRNLVPTYEEVLSSRRVMDAVRRELGLQWSDNEYEDRIRIKPNEKAQTLDVLVRADSPLEAARIATGAARVMTQVAAEVMQEDRLQVLDPAVPPEKPVSPRIILELVLAIMLGMMVGVGVAYLLDVFDRRIRDEAAVERRLGLPVLGVIPHIDS
ncbi:YveK family protein [Thermaerobacter litoralis]